MAKKGKFISKTLDDVIMATQIENFIDRLSSSEKDKNQKFLKKLLIMVVPYILLTMGYLIFKIPLLLILGCVYILGSYTIYTVDKTIKEINEFYDTKQKNISSVDKKRSRKKGEDFYRREIKRNLDVPKNEEYQKYMEALKKQQQANNFKVNDDNTEIPSKDVILNRLCEEVEFYYDLYELPPYIISDSSWDIFFDVVYNFFEKKNIVDKFYENMSEMIRKIFAKALVDKETQIDLKSFIDNLDFILNCGISKKELLSLKKEILENLKKKKVLYLNDFNVIYTRK